MGRARIQGTNCILLLHSVSTGVPIPLGEIDSFSAKSNTTIIKSRPIGYIREGATVVQGSWDLSFTGGKVDWSLAHFYWLQDAKLIGGEMAPMFYISQTITHYNGTIESYVFEDVTLYGFEQTIDTDNASENIQGFSPFRRMGLIDTSYFSLDASNIMREIAFKDRRVQQFKNMESLNDSGSFGAGPSLA